MSIVVAVRDRVPEVDVDFDSSKYAACVMEKNYLLPEILTAKPRQTARPLDLDGT